MASSDEKTNAAHQEQSVLETKEGVEGSHAVAKQKTTPYMVFFAAYIVLSAWIYNFDLGYSGIVLLMKPYNQAFGTCALRPNADGDLVQKCSLTATQQSLISLTIVFLAIGSFVAGWTGNYLGRRGTIQTGAIIIAVGSAGMLATTGNFAAHMTCKCIQGFALGHVLSAISTYGVECVSANKRGMLMSLFNLGLGFGNMVAAAVCMGSSRSTTNASWQTPVACQLPLSLILAGGAALLPESPSWLLTKGKEQRARKSFSRFLSKPVDDPEVTSR